MQLRPLLKNPNFVRFYDHWLAIRQDNPVPSRSHVDPIAIGPALQYVWLYEYLPEQRNYRCRLAGEHIQDTFKNNMSGLMVDQIYRPDMAAVVMGYWNQIRETPAVIFGESVSPGKNPNRPLRSHRLILPLTGKDGTISQIFGITRYEFDTYNFDFNKGIDGSKLQVIPCAELED